TGGIISIAYFSCVKHYFRRQVQVVVFNVGYTFVLVCFQITHGVVGIIIAGVGAVFKTVGVVGSICHFQQAVAVIGIGQLVNLYRLSGYFLPIAVKAQNISVFVIG